MSAKAPPIPAAQQPKRGSRSSAPGSQGQRGDADANLRAQGRNDGVRQVMTNQGRQQDR